MTAVLPTLTRRLAAGLLVGLLAAPLLTRAADGPDLAAAVAATPALAPLQSAIQAAGWAETLQTAGPHTLLAPTQAAFDALPPGTLDELKKPENKARLVALLGYHLIPGKLDADKLRKLVKEGKGIAMVETSTGVIVRLRLLGEDIRFTDKKGSTATVQAGSQTVGNGVLHTLDKVLMPE